MNTEQENQTHTEPASSPVDLSVTTIPATPFYKSSQMLFAIVLAIAILAGAGYYVYNVQNTKGVVIAIVDGEKIYLAELERNIRNTESLASQQGVDVADPAIQTEIRAQSLQMLIDNKVLTNAATKAKTEVSDEETKAKYDELVAQVGSEEVLTTQLTEAGLTVEELRKNIYDRVLVDKYIEAVTDIEDITVTDEEITEFLSQFPPEELPPLEQIKADVEARIFQQEQQEILTTLITDLKSKAVIEEKI